jgi:penicillin amidase
MIKYLRNITVFLSYLILTITPVLAANTNTTISVLKTIMKSSLADVDGTLDVDGLAGQITILRDDHGVPTIQASNKVAAIYALGFVHGQERFFQMDLLRRIASGEMAALIGPSGLAVDRQNRPFLLRRKAQVALKRLSPEQYKLLTAYTAGVNAGLTHLKQSPFEYAVLKTQPQRWREEDSLLVIGALYFDLQENQPRREYARGWIQTHSTSTQTAFLLPESSEWDVPLVGVIPQASPIPDEPPPSWWGRAIKSHLPLPPIDIGKIDIGKKGSNGWLVQSDGRAVLANDMHLSRALPNIWYKAALQYRNRGHQWHVTGITLPGVPVVISGSNGHIAWGFTNGYIDVFDWIRFPGETQTHTEVLQVNGDQDQHLVVRMSKWGPVFHTAMGDMAMHWVISLPGSFDLKLTEMSESASVDEALDIGSQMGIPIQNLLIADHQGNIGWTLAGALPDRVIKSKGKADTFPLNVSNAAWRDKMLSPTAHPRLKNPATGYIVASNNRLLFNRIGDDFGDGGAALGVRAFSIVTGLKLIAQADVPQMYHLQLNTRAYLGMAWRRWLRQSLLNRSHAPKKGDRAILALLTQWNGNADKSSTAYALISQWRRAVYFRLFGALDTQLNRQWPKTGYAKANPRWDVTVNRLMYAGRWVPAEFESWQDFTLQILDKVWTGPLREGRTTWGMINHTQYGHPLAASLPSLANLLSVPVVPLSGDKKVIQVNSPTSGSTERLVVSPGMEGQAILSLPSGQSGNPLSPWWLDNFDPWIRELPQPLLPGSTIYRLTLHGEG